MYLIILILSLNSTIATAQLDGIDNGKTFQAKFDLRVRGGISIPLGKYRLLTNISDDRSAADIGGHVELLGSFTPMPSSPWRIGLTFGYMHHSFQSEASRLHFSLFKLEGSPWNSLYSLIGIHFSSKKKLYYSIGASAGILGYSGGNITSADIILDTLEVLTWSYGIDPVGAVQASFSVGYHFTPKFSMFANAAILYAAGLRKGDLLEERFALNGQNMVQQPVLEQKSSVAQNQTTIFTLNIGIGCRYKFYEAPEEFNYKFNLEENQ